MLVTGAVLSMVYTCPAVKGALVTVGGYAGTVCIEPYGPFAPSAYINGYCRGSSAAAYTGYAGCRLYQLVVNANELASYVAGSGAERNCIIVQW